MPDIRSHLERLASQGFVDVYSVDGVDLFEIDRFDEDSLREAIRRRGRSNYKPNPAKAGLTSSSEPTSADQGPKRNWVSTFPTVRLFGDQRFLRLTPEEQHILFRLYARCDRFGRGPADAAVLGIHLCLPAMPDIRSHLERLASQGFVDVYSVDGEESYEIERFDEDLLQEVKDQRGKSNYNPNPKKDGSTSSSSSRVEVRSKSGSSPVEMKGAEPKGAESEPKKRKKRESARAVPRAYEPAVSLSRPELDKAQSPKAKPAPQPAETIDWWDSDCEREGKAWWTRLAELHPQFTNFRVEDVKRVSAEFPKDFPEAAHKMRTGVKGFQSGDSIAWLRRMCGYARENRDDRIVRITARQNPEIWWFSSWGRSGEEGMGKLPKAVSAWFAFALYNDPAWIRDYGEGLEVRVIENPGALASYCRMFQCSDIAVKAAEPEVLEVLRMFARDPADSELLEFLCYQFGITMPR